MAKESKDDLCPRCSSRMRKSFSSISGNAKYLNFVCSQCGHKETKCTGILG